MMNSDLISRKAAIEAMEKSEWGYLWECEQVINVVKALPSAEPEQKWIPVTEGLPEKGIEVIVCNADGDMEICDGYPSTKMPGEFIWYTSGWYFGDVIAWMPLPEPYEKATR